VAGEILEDMYIRDEGFSDTVYLDWSNSNLKFEETSSVNMDIFLNYHKINFLKVKGKSVRLNVVGAHISTADILITAGLAYIEHPSTIKYSRIAATQTYGLICLSGHTY
jgi:hypothetical protein